MQLFLFEMFISEDVDALNRLKLKYKLPVLERLLLCLKTYKIALL